MSSIEVQSFGLFDYHQKLPLQLIGKFQDNLLLQ